MKNQNIGYRIRKLRESRDFSQEYMASKLDMTTSGFSKIERGITDPPSKRLLQIAEVLGVDVKELFGEKPDSFMEKTSSYGFATKSDISELYMLYNHIKEDHEKMKAEIAALKKAKKK